MKCTIETITREKWEDRCKYCQQKICGTSESSARLNMKFHVDNKHKRKDKK